MNLPQILIEFKSKAQSIIQRSERGVVAVILKDNTADFIMEFASFFIKYRILIYPITLGYKGR